MESYEIEFQPSVRKDFRKLSPDNASRILPRIEELAVDNKSDLLTLHQRSIPTALKYLQLPVRLANLKRLQSLQASIAL